MATLTRGQTFGATETVTNTKLHNLVDNGSISAIVNADIDASAAIVDTKLADITTGNKVRGISLGNLPSIPSGSGLIPTANIPLMSLTSIAASSVQYSLLGVSLVSIPNSALAPLSRVSWVDGISLRNLASTPVDQQVRYNLLVQSLASGGIPQYNGSNNFVGGISGLRLISTTSPSGVATTGNITIDDDRLYLVQIGLGLDSATNDVFALRINAISTATRYLWVFDSTTLTTTPASTLTGGNSDSEIEFSLSRRYVQAELVIDTRAAVSWEATVYGKGIAAPSGGAINSAMDIWGALNADAATDISSFEIITVSGNAFTGTVRVYEYGQ